MYRFPIHFYRGHKVFSSFLQSSCTASLHVSTSKRSAHDLAFVVLKDNVVNYLRYYSYSQTVIYFIQLRY